MITQVVENYIPVNVSGLNKINPAGTSASPKGLIFHIPVEKSKNIKVLDIGFGLGGLGIAIKSTAETMHWGVDGIDSLEANCSNATLFESKVYRNISMGLIQDMPMDQLRDYDVICLLDVIEHLDIETAKWLIRTLFYSMNDDAYLFISTPPRFYPQDQQQDGDFEEHPIGVPASSMLALIPIMYSINEPLIGGFVYAKDSMHYVDHFQPTANKNFGIEMGRNIARCVGLNCTPGVMFKY